jgi:hypothetical protein
VQMRKPAGPSYAQAATISLGAITVGQGLYQKSLGLTLPTDPTTSQDYVLIYGGGTSVGGLAIQFAKLYGTPPPCILNSPCADPSSATVRAIRWSPPATPTRMNASAAWARPSAWTIGIPRADTRFVGSPGTVCGTHGTRSPSSRRPRCVPTPCGRTRGRATAPRIPLRRPGKTSSRARWSCTP